MTDNDAAYPRDLIGYANKPPHPRWPGDSKLAVQFVLNYEEGGENSVLHGDRTSEIFLSEIIGAQPFAARHLSMESLYEYGSRVGFWRLHKLFTQRQIPITVFAVTTALQKNPKAMEAMLRADWEIASHGYRWISYQDISEAQEEAHIEKAITFHKAHVGQEKLGWYTGRTSPATLKLIARRSDILYCADSYADDLPYYDMQNGHPLLMVPYTLDTNDMRFATAQGFHNAEQFYQYLKDAFDVLYAEGEECPKMLSIGLHCRLIGKPARIAGLMKFIDYIQNHKNVWICTRQQIAEHWLSRFPLSRSK